MQRNIVETVLGAVVLLVAAAFLFFFYRTTDIRPAAGYELTASFSKIDGLQNGAQVRVSGVKVGQVVDFKLDPQTYNAIVTMSIQNDVKLPKDTAAVIASSGLLDGKFMSLEPGSDEDMLKPGERIQYSQSTPSLEQLLGQVIFSLTKGDKKADADTPDAASQAAPEAAASPAAQKTMAPADTAAPDDAAPASDAPAADAPANAAPADSAEQPAHP